jgi:sterol desaturase/sphingolipid hydroxylase (fatty acid hydroxylase superfamily)
VSAWDAAAATMACPGVLATVGLWYAAMAIEFALGRGRGRPHREWWFDLTSAGLIVVFSRPLAAFCVAAACMLLLPAQQGMLQDWPLWLAFPVVFVGDEFLHYWYHRFSHRWRWLWRIHEAHHTPTQLCAAMAYRDHALWFVLAPNAWWAGAMLYLGLHQGYALSIAVIGIWNIVNHLEVPLDRRVDNPAGKRWLARIGKIWILPSVHHAHHGKGPGATPQGNFAPTLALMDRLFGTNVEPEQPVARYGLRGKPKHWVDLLFWPVPFAAAGTALRRRLFRSRTTAQARS